MAAQIFTQSIRQEIHFNNTEGLDYRDLNDLQRLTNRRMGEHFARELLWNPGRYSFSQGSGTLPDIVPVDWALSVIPTGSFGVSVVGGTVFAKATDPGDGGGAGQADYGSMILRVADQAFTVDAAHATLPRHDIVSVKLEALAADGSQVRKFRTDLSVPPSTASMNKRRAYKLTTTYTPGVAAATPTDPATPAGETMIARLYIPAAETSLFTNQDAVFQDFRFPFGNTFKSYMASDAFVSTGWTLDGDGVRAATGASQILRIPLQHPGMFAGRRLDFLSLNYKLSGGSTVKIRKRSASSTAAISWVDVADLTSLFTLDATQRNRNINQSQFIEVTSGPNIPIWNHGMKSSILSGSGILVLEVVSGASGDNVRGGVVHWAGR